MKKQVCLFLLNFTFLKQYSSYRIFNGNEIETLTKFPYQVAIFARKQQGANLSSGSIISVKFILTCAHCIQNSSSVGAFYGITDISQPYESNYQSINSSNYIIHPDYSSFRNDIALILTYHDIQFGGMI